MTMCPSRQLLFLLALASASAFAQGRTFGAAMPPGEAVPLGIALGAGLPTSPAKLAGRITEVCQKEGCWLVLADGESFARVNMAGHAFSVPADAAGDALVHGSISLVDVPEAQARHLREDGAATPASREYRIEADSVQLLD
jgi:hypothetical protein